MFFILCFFFFKQKTAYEMRISDWSSDVCSSDLRIFRELRIEIRVAAVELEARERAHHRFDLDALDSRLRRIADDDAAQRDELRDLEVRIVGAKGCDVEPQAAVEPVGLRADLRSEEHTSELQSIMRISYAV